MRLRKLGMGAVSAALMCLVLLLGGASAASADIPTGTDPQVNGCNTAGLSNLATAQMPNRVLTITDPQTGRSVASAYLRYSSVCKSQWVTVYASSGYDALPSIWVQNQTGTDQGQSIYSGGGSYWTYVLGGMQYRTGCGGVQMYRAAPWQYMGWYYLGCA